MNYIDNINYYNDERVRVTDKGLHRVEDKNGQITIFATIIDDDGINKELVLPGRYEVCSLCGGRGKHVNPSIDSGGLSAEDFHDDPEFAEDYFNGVYDVACSKCSGMRVTPVVDYDAADPKDVKEYEDYLRFLGESEAEQRRALALGY